jgi:Flp pilus assembly protein TadG
VLELAYRAKAMWADRRGVAAIEFGIFAIFLSLALVNVTDVSIYIYQRMQAENATEVAAQAAWKTCVSHLPATTNCPALATAVQNAVKSTSLGTSVSLVSGSPSEGYYCINSSNALQYVSAVSSKPADCTAAGTPSLQPGDYIQVQTTFTYTPLFPGLSVSSTFPTPINRTAMMRLG